MKNFCPACNVLTSGDCGGHKETYSGPIMYPHKCPVCLGSGKVSWPPNTDINVGWASNTAGTYTCPSCEKGIVWR